MGMRFRRMANSQSAGLGLLVTDHGMALAQITPGLAEGDDNKHWYWQPQPLLHNGLDVAALSQARQRSGFQGRSLAMAIPPAQLLTYQFASDSRLHPHQLHASVKAQLQKVLPWPLAETVWDCQITPAVSTAPATQPAHRPAWLNQALQAQPSHTIDVLAVPRAWALACEDACQQAGLQLRRLEPAWQARQRWQTYVQQHTDVGARTGSPAEWALSEEEDAVLWGLALGAVSA